jgi:predicted PurR-regulated permease PerM
MNVRDHGSAQTGSPDASSDVRTIKRVIVAVLFFLVLGICYIAQEVLIPLTLALLLSLLLSPLFTLLQRLRLPRAAGSIVVLAVAVAAIACGVTMLAQPARDWMTHAPQNIQAIQRRFASVRASIHAAQMATKKIENLAQPVITTPTVVASQQPGLLASAATVTPRVLTAVAEVLLLAYFFLSSGNNFLRRMVEVAPGMSEKKMVVHIAREVQDEMSRYLLMVSAINLLLGAATALAMFLLGVPNPLLWGVVAAVLNFAPYVGPAMTGIGLLLVGITTFDTLDHALAVPTAFFALAIIEGQLVTPTIIGRRLALDPTVVFVWLLMWSSLWGVIGILLAGPLIACFRIVCQHVDALKSVGILIGDGSIADVPGKK